MPRGCPVTHCGIVRDVDLRTGVIVWCVTGPLQTRQKGFKDLGYYTAEAYEGLIAETRIEVRIGEAHSIESVCRPEINVGGQRRADALCHPQGLREDPGGLSGC